MAVAGVAAAGAVVGTALSGGGDQPEQHLPGSAVLFAKVDLDPAASQKIDALRFLRTLPDRMQAHGYQFFHGSPRDPVMEYVLKSDGFLEPDKMQQLFALLDRPCFVGHTHWPGVHRPDYRFTQATDDQREFRLEGPCIVNVGSVGQPRDGDWRSAYAVYDHDNQQIYIRRVPYDLATAQKKIRAAGLPEPLAERLSLGK